MAAGSTRFCEHGNLPYVCAKCREVRRARWASRSPPRVAPPALKGGKIPARPWSLERPLGPEAQEAVRTVLQAGGGVLRMPAAVGLRDASATLLASLRHRNESTVLLVPNAHAAEDWDRFLSSGLNVPAAEVDATGRSLRDRARGAPFVILTPDAAMRDLAALRGMAPRASLIVDSPESGTYADSDSVFRLPFAFRTGFMVARLLPPEEEAWPRLDALGGVTYEIGIGTAVRQGLLRPLHARAVAVPALSAAAIADVVSKGLGRARAVLFVDDAETARRVEEPLSRLGIVPRSVTGAASEGLLERAGRALSEGAAQVLVATAEAPTVPTGPVDRIVVAALDMPERKVEQAVLSQLGPAGRGLEVVLLIPEKAPAEGVRRSLARRVRLLVPVGGLMAPPLPWLADAGDLPVLPPALAAAVVERSRDGWHSVLGLLPELLEAHPEEEAVAALADHHVAARLGVPPVPLGPVPASALALLSVGDTGLTLSSLAMVFAEAQSAFAAVLRKDLSAFREAYAGAPVLHHLAPDPRALLIASLARRTEAGIELEAGDPRGSAETLERRGGRLPAPATTPRETPPVALAAEPHMVRLLSALASERTHEEETSIAEIARIGDAERVRRGRTLVGLALLGRDRTATGMVLRFGVPVPSGSPRPPLPYTELSPGTLVDLSSGPVYDALMRGTVNGVSAREVQVVVDETKDRLAPGRDVRIDIISNPKVYDVLARAVRRVYGAGSVTPASSGLRAHLLLDTAGSAPERRDVRLFDPGLDPSQRAAVACALGSSRLALIHGPPGTGKTTTLVEIIRQEAALGHRVLVTADSNAAVDNVLDACLRAGVPGVRTGPLPALTRAHLALFHIDTLRERAPGVDWLRRVPVLFTTHVSSGALPDELGFDVVVQDEASQATEPASLLSLQRAPRSVLAGDHLQLPPVVQSREAEDLGLAVSLFERLHEAYGESHGTLLSVQYRMHPDIVAWSNARFYDGRITTAVSPPVMAGLVSAGLLPAGPRALFVDVAGVETVRHTSKERSEEAVWIDRFVRGALATGVPASGIAVIAAYRAQMRLLRGMLEGTGVDVGTIDAFQGGERDVVVVSLVRGNPQGEVGFVREPRRLNVAMTRARRHLVVVGDAGTLAQEPLLRSLLATLGRLETVPPEK